MCDDKDMEGVRLWFYGGTPPVDEPELEDQELTASLKSGWTWRPGPAAERPTEERAAA